MRIFFFLFFVLHAVNSFCQSAEYKKHLADVIKKVLTGKTFTYKTNKDKETTTTSYLTYLGKTKRKDLVLYIQETYPAATVRHGYVMLLLIDSSGNCYKFRDIDRPIKMKNGVLYFKHQQKGKKSYYFVQSLNKGIPKFLCADKKDCYNY